MRNPPRTTGEYAHRYRNAGISILPIARDGSKQPASNLLPNYSWKPLEKELPDEATVEDWWRPGNPPGIGAIAGEVSGELELIDFDQRADEVFPLWQKLVEEEHPGLIARLSIVQSPGGWHAWHRSPDVVVEGNTVLATDPSLPGKKKRLIETRGEGGYALVPGSPLACHISKKPYLFADIGIPLWDLGPCSIDEHYWLHQCACSFDRSPPKPKPLPSRSEVGDSLRPGEDFDMRGPDWAEILEPHGWTCAAHCGDERRWKRPGKDAPGWSATTGHCKGSRGEDLLRVFSTNAAPFDDGTYGKFRATAILTCNGDLKEAARKLGKLGYGSPSKKATASILLTADVLRWIATAKESNIRIALEAINQRLDQKADEE